MKLIFSFDVLRAETEVGGYFPCGPQKRYRERIRRLPKNPQQVPDL